MAQSNFIDGTAAQLVAQGLIIGGEQVDAVGISVLAKYGIIKTIGKAAKVEGKRGKLGNIYRVPGEIGSTTKTVV